MTELNYSMPLQELLCSIMDMAGMETSMASIQIVEKDATNRHCERSNFPRCHAALPGDSSQWPPF
ncbi:MAG: hypothetical protein ACXU93_13005 [Thermodesulfobacteriota bacterium]